LPHARASWPDIQECDVWLIVIVRSGGCSGGMIIVQG
jgi:hypothetical protein